MKMMPLTLFAAAAIGAITIGSATAMPFSANTGAAVVADGLVQDVRVVCNRRGNCWNTGPRYRTGRYYRGYDRGYYRDRGYGYRRGPHLGIGVGPVGVGVGIF
ncbi:MAG: hypothetical protein WCG92_03065 [Hyphomicrobiales bacterium]